MWISYRVQEDMGGVTNAEHISDAHLFERKKGTCAI